MIKINMGCGWRDFGKDWIHIDGGDYPHLDSKDIFNLPYEDNSVDLIYASHVIEYFNREEVKDVLNEWIRVLKPNGKLRLAVPDFEVIVGLYFNLVTPPKHVATASVILKDKPGTSMVMDFSGSRAQDRMSNAIQMIKSRGIILFAVIPCPIHNITMYVFE